MEPDAVSPRRVASGVLGVIGFQTGPASNSTPRRRAPDRKCTELLLSGEWCGGGLGAIRKRLPSSDDGALNLYHVLVEVVEVGVVQGLLRRDALVRRVLEALVQEVQARIFETRRELRQLEPRPRGKDALVVS